LQKGARHGGDISNTSPLVAAAITTPRKPDRLGMRLEAIVGGSGVVSIGAEVLTAYSQPAFHPSSAAKRLAHDLIGSRRIGVPSERWLILVRRGNHRQQHLES